MEGVAAVSLKRLGGREGGFTGKFGFQGNLGRDTS
jgi:hypothetical protein